MLKYNFQEIEEKWQKKWQEEGTFSCPTLPEGGKTFYGLVEFPYPSGQGLHVGHARPYTAMDVVARKRRMEGFQVLFPIGYDAFGLPTENYAIKHHVHPAKVTRQNIDNFRRQLQMLGYSFDWSREINTTDPDYYRWTQWIFLKLWEKGLAYKSTMPVNWCTSCLCVLANEEVVDGGCERCGAPVIRREKSQWMLKITQYAQRLIDDLDGLDFPERVKAQQRNWIGRSTGAELSFQTTTGESILVYTTRPDTLFGVTYLVLSPEHTLVKGWLPQLDNRQAVEEYQKQASSKSDLERTELNKEKTGVCLTGVRAIHPATGEELPIFISDYVLSTYGTGAIMAVPGHDQRDWDFARAFGCPIREVVSGGDLEQEAFVQKDQGGILVNSDFLNGMTVKEAIPAMVHWLEEKGIGQAKVNFKLRDWVFSRQRYWGEPIPMVHCPACGWQPLPEDQLPLLLPDVEHYEPTEDGESPLSQMEDWVQTTCPCCGGPARRETDTMPQWAGSSWYFLRYMDPHNSQRFADRELVARWAPVSWYNGGMEHTTLHLLYSRFWYKFLYDLGEVPTKEPYQKRTSHGMILGEGGEKMAKSRGNVINPNDVIAQYGADTMRTYIMFIGDFEKAAAWSEQGVKGCKRFLDRVWAIMTEGRWTGEGHSKVHEVSIHRTIRKVSEDIEAMKFNTAVAALMSLLNEFYSQEGSRGDLQSFLLLLSPFAPHMCQELWEQLGFEGEVYFQPWPSYDPEKLVTETTQMAVQVNGKLRANILVPTGSDEEAVVQAALAQEKIEKLAQGMELVKTIVVPGRLVNLILKPKA